MKIKLIKLNFYSWVESLLIIWSTKDLLYEVHTHSYFMDSYCPSVMDMTKALATTLNHQNASQWWSIMELLFHQNKNGSNIRLSKFGYPWVRKKIMTNSFLKRRLRNDRLSP